MTNIKLQYHRMSSGQKRAADVLLSKAENAGSVTMRECAASAAVGQPTVVRMLEKAGYESWSDFIKEVWRGHTAEESLSGTPDVLPRGSGAVVQSIRADLQMIADMAQHLDMKQLDKVVKCIKRAKIIDVYGTDNSANAAAELSGRLLHLGLTSRNYSDLFFQKISAGHLNEKDVVISFSISGETKAVVEAMRSARQCKAVTIAVTGDVESQLAQEADYVFRTPTIKFSEVSKWNSSRISQIAFVDALCVAIMESDLERFNEQLSRSTKEFEDDISDRARAPHI
ncbi:MAG: MurR/RpiR family transcriptional regulator [Lachnospiraceae bacterium]